MRGPQEHLERGKGETRYLLSLSRKPESQALSRAVCGLGQLPHTASLLPPFPGMEWPSLCLASVEPPRGESRNPEEVQGCQDAITQEG